MAGLQDAVLDRWLDGAGERVPHRLHHGSRRRDEGEERRQFLVGEIQPLARREHPQLIDGEGMHGRRIAARARIDKGARTPIMPDMSESEIVGWLREFEGACRGRDFAAGRQCFADDAVAFGTWATQVVGLDNIEREQWRNVWPRIREFRFEDHPVTAASGDTAWIAGAWSSDATGPDGRPFTRRGRATFVLARRDGRWRCVHSHVSLLPSQSESAHGRL
jgi:ketosteroid isomerase-like protein